MKSSLMLAMIFCSFATSNGIQRTKNDLNQRLLSLANCNQQAQAPTFCCDDLYAYSKNENLIRKTQKESVIKAFSIFIKKQCDDIKAIQSASKGKKHCTCIARKCTLRNSNLFQEIVTDIGTASFPIDHTRLTRERLTGYSVLELLFLSLYIAEEKKILEQRNFPSLEQLEKLNLFLERKSLNSIPKIIPEQLSLLFSKEASMLEWRDSA